MSNEVDAKTARERAKEIAEQRRAERRNRKRKCVLCGVEESDKTPLGPSPGWHRPLVQGRDRLPGSAGRGLA